MKGFQLRIFRSAMNDAVQGLLFYVAHACNLIDGQAALVAEFDYSICNDLIVFHRNNPNLASIEYRLFFCSIRNHFDIGQNQINLLRAQFFSGGN